MQEQERHQRKAALAMAVKGTSTTAVSVLALPVLAAKPMASPSACQRQQRPLTHGQHKLLVAHLLVRITLLHLLQSTPQHCM
jgi:hypothetical protein